MKVIVAGSRSIRLYKVVENAINKAFNHWMANDPENWKLYTQPTIISGGAQGVDFFGELYAKKHSLPLEIFPANWDEFGKKAGILRNKVMGEHADRLIAVWDGQSKGTKQMITYMQGLNKPVYIYTGSDENPTH